MTPEQFCYKKGECQTVRTIRQGNLLQTADWKRSLLQPRMLCESVQPGQRGADQHPLGITEMTPEQWCHKRGSYHIVSTVGGEVCCRMQIGREDFYSLAFCTSQCTQVRGEHFRIL